MNRVMYWCSVKIAFFGLAWLGSTAVAQVDFVHEPIDYERATVNDPIIQLQRKLESGDETLKWDANTGWLTSILNKLDVSITSQVLVFSKTSLQVHKVSPLRPRAIYFNDAVYVAWIPRSETLELSAVDAKLGAIFYTLDQRNKTRPRIHRDQGVCMACHGGARTKHVPGYLVRSVFPQIDGQPNFRLGTVTTDHSTPFRKRFGGWYVTGDHGTMRHRGNAIATGDEQDPIPWNLGANCQDLNKYFRTQSYPSAKSDIVALMVLEHQTQMHNLLTRASYVTRHALYHQKAMNRMLKRPDDFVSETTTRRIESVGEELLRYMMFVHEFQLTSPIHGDAQFQKRFMQHARYDRQHRSLRQFDLRTRLFRYPCSYLIHSEAFESLPNPVYEFVLKRLKEVLTSSHPPNEFAHLDTNTRRAMLELLRETKPRFAALFVANTQNRANLVE